MKEADLSRKSFLRFGATLALMPAGALALAACSGDPQGPEPAQDEPAPRTTSREQAATEETSAEETSAEETTGEVDDGAGREPEGVISAADEVAPGSAFAFESEGGPAVLVRLSGGELVAYSAVCTHRGCAVAFDAGSGLLACPCHGSTFDPENGAAVVNGPAASPLAPVGVGEQGGYVVPEA